MPEQLGKADLLATQDLLDIDYFMAPGSESVRTPFLGIHNRDLEGSGGVVASNSSGRRAAGDQEEVSSRIKAFGDGYQAQTLTRARTPGCLPSTVSATIRTRTEFTVGVDISLIRTYAISLQEERSTGTQAHGSGRAF